MRSLSCFIQAGPPLPQRSLKVEDGDSRKRAIEIIEKESWPNIVALNMEEWDHETRNVGFFWKLGKARKQNFL